MPYKVDTSVDALRFSVADTAIIVTGERIETAAMRGYYADLRGRVSV